MSFTVTQCAHTHAPHCPVSCHQTQDLTQQHHLRAAAAPAKKPSTLTCSWMQLHNNSTTIKKCSKKKAAGAKEQQKQTNLHPNILNPPPFPPAPALPTATVFNLGQVCSAN